MLSLVASVAMGYYYLALFIPRVAEAHAAAHLADGYDFGHDFYPIWLTSRRGINPYSPATTKQIQRGLFGRPLGSKGDPPGDYRTFAYPAFTDLLFWPTALLPFPVARILMVFVLAALTAGSILLWAAAVFWRPGGLTLTAITLLVLASYPVLEGLYAGQLGLFVGFLIAASVYGLTRGRMVLGGALLAVATIKPQMVILAVIYLAAWSLAHWRQRFHLLASFGGALGFLTAAAFLVWPHWISSWIGVALGYHHYADGPLVDKLLGIGTVPAGIAGAAAAAALGWKARSTEPHSAEFLLGLSLTFCLATVTVLPSQGFQDQVILLPAIFMVCSRWKAFTNGRAPHALARITFALLLWSYVAAIIVMILRPFLPSAVFYSAAVFSLPVRTAAAFPFGLLGVLALGARSSVGSGMACEADRQRQGGPTTPGYRSA